MPIIDCRYAIRDEFAFSFHWWKEDRSPVIVPRVRDEADRWASGLPFAHSTEHLFVHFVPLVFLLLLLDRKRESKQSHAKIAHYPAASSIHVFFFFLLFFLRNQCQSIKTIRCARGGPRSYVTAIGRKPTQMVNGVCRTESWIMSSCQCVHV